MSGQEGSEHDTVDAPAGSTAGVAAGAPSDNTTLQSVLADFARDGFVDAYDVNDDGTLCAPSGDPVAPENVTVVQMRRLEGASDPDDMVLVAGLEQGTGDKRGVVVLKYGPGATEGEASVLVAWQDELSRADRQSS